MKDQSSRPPAQPERLDWVDYAKGISIIFVVMLYAVTWVEDATGQRGWLHSLVDFAAPYRMPAFFLVSGLLLPRTIDQHWRRYLDRKVLHFAYFYVLWLSLGFLLRGPWMAAESSWPDVGRFYLLSFVQPFAMLWFIYVLPLFFLATRVVRRLPRGLVWVAAAGLHLAAFDTGFEVFDKFALYFLFFYTGYAFAPVILEFGRSIARHRRAALAGLAVWSVFEARAVFSGDADAGFGGLAFALLGSAALCTVSVLLAERRSLGFLRHCGQHSLVIYLAFFIPLMFGRAFATHTGLAEDSGNLAFVLTFLSVLGALAINVVLRGTRFEFLFERPDWSRLDRPGLERVPPGKVATLR